MRIRTLVYEKKNIVIGFNNIHLQIWINFQKKSIVWRHNLEIRIRTHNSYLVKLGGGHRHIRITPANLDKFTKNWEFIGSIHKWWFQGTNYMSRNTPWACGGGDGVDFSFYQNYKLKFTFTRFIQIRLETWIYLKENEELIAVHISWKILYGEGEVFVTYELPPAIYIHPLHQNTTSHFDIFVPKIIEGTIHK